MIKPNVEQLIAFFIENGKRINRISDLPRESGVYLITFEGGNSPPELCTMGRSNNIYRRIIRLMCGSALYDQWNYGQRHLKAFHLAAMQKLLRDKDPVYRVIPCNHHFTLERELRNTYLGANVEIVTSLSFHTRSDPAGRELLSKLLLSYSGPPLNDVFIDLLGKSYQETWTFWRLLHHFKGDFRRFFGGYFFPYGERMGWWYQRHGLAKSEDL